MVRSRLYIEGEPPLICTPPPKEIALLEDVPVLITTLTLSALTKFVGEEAVIPLVPK